MSTARYRVGKTETAGAFCFSLDRQELSEPYHGTVEPVQRGLETLPGVQVEVVQGLIEQERSIELHDYHA